MSSQAGPRPPSLVPVTPFFRLFYPVRAGARADNALDGLFARSTRPLKKASHRDSFDRMLDRTNSASGPAACGVLHHPSHPTRTRTLGASFSKSESLARFTITRCCGLRSSARQSLSCAGITHDLSNKRCSRPSTTKSRRIFECRGRGVMSHFQMGISTMHS